MQQLPQISDQNGEALNVQLEKSWVSSIPRNAKKLNEKVLGIRHKKPLGQKILKLHFVTNIHSEFFKRFRIASTG